MATASPDLYRTSERAYMLQDIDRDSGRPGENATFPPNRSFDEMRRSEERNNAIKPPIDPSDTSRHPGLFERLGTLTLAANVATLVLLLVSVVFIFYLWFGDHDDIAWRKIMFGAWIDQGVTLCSLAIRLAAATQAGTAVSLLASISVESPSSGGVLLQQAPALSLARYVNTGPITSLYLFWKGLYWENDFFVLASVVLLATTSLVSQLTSTLLLWDIRPGSMLGFANTNQRQFGIPSEHYIQSKMGNLKHGVNYWATSSTGYSMFVESSTPPGPLPNHISDTGPTIRGLVPIQSAEERVAVTTYAGPASLFDARVVCIRPKIHDMNITEDLQFTGRLELGTLPDDVDGIVVLNNNTNSSSAGYLFNCAVDDVVGVSPIPGFKVCGLPPDAGGLINSLDPTQNSTTKHTFASWNKSAPRWWANLDSSGHPWPIELGHAILFLRVEFSSPDAKVENLFPPGWYSSLQPVLEERGPWQQFKTAGIGGYAQLSVTACYDALYHSQYNQRTKHLQDFPIRATKVANQSEPQLIWNNSSRVFDTGAVQAQLDGVYNSMEHRPVMELDTTDVEEVLQSYISTWNPQTWESIEKDGFSDGTQRTSNLFNVSTSSPHPHQDRTMDFLNSGVWQPLRTVDNGYYTILVKCGDCVEDRTGAGEVELHPILGQMVEKILVETDNPALAWQATTTFVMRSAYYDWLPMFDATDNVSTTKMVSYLMPIRHVGFTIVMVNLLVHYVLVAVAFLWFICSTRYSRINCAWQAVAQIKTADTEELLEKATVMNDKTAGKWIDEHEGLRTRRFKIKHGNGTDRVCLV